MPHSCRDTGRDALPTRADDDDDEDEGAGKMRAPQVDSGNAKQDRLNPPTEYKVASFDLSGDELEAKLNELGAEGWALIATTPQFVFRRMKKTEDEKKKARVGFGISK